MSRYQEPVLSRLGPRPTKVFALLGLSGAAALTLLATTDVRAAPPRDVTVSIDNFTFSPPEIIVAPGTRVVWVNKDDIQHTVVETKKTFRSKALDTDDAFSFTFADEGEFAYFCSLHPHMTGKVVVRTGAS